MTLLEYILIQYWKTQQLHLGTTLCIPCGEERVEVVETVLEMLLPKGFTVYASDEQVFVSKEW